MHCVWSTQNRQSCLTLDLRDRLWPYLGGIAKHHQMKALAIGGAGRGVTSFCHVERIRDISCCYFWTMPRYYNFWVYIVTNRNHSVPYIGVTNRLSRGTWEHREGTGTGFASSYQCKKPVYYEHYRHVRDAIARESQPKKWSRAKKIDLINRLNPNWLDLGADVLQDR